MNRSLLRMLALASLACPTWLHANRPLTTEDASVAPARKGELELSYDYAANFGASGSHVLLAAPGVGIANRAEFTLELPFVLNHQEGEGLAQGLGDIRTTLKVLLYPETGPIPGFAIQGYFKFDTGDGSTGLGTGDREAGFFGIVSKEVGDFMLHGMLGLDFIVSGSSRGQRNIIYGAAVDYTVGKFLNRPFHLVTEVFGNSNFDPAISFSPATWLLGAIYELSEAWALDCGIGRSLTSDGSSLHTTVGATFIFP